MEGPLFIPPNRPQRRPEQTCPECGHSFRPRSVADGAEELCDICYAAQFEDLRQRHWQKPGRSPHVR